MSNLPRQDVLQSIREGNSAAFQQLFDGCYEGLCRYAFTLLRDADEAEDTVQSMFLKLWEKRETLDILSDIQAYIYRSVYNQCLNQIEHRLVVKKHSEHLAHVISHSTQPDTFPEELETKIKSIIESLPTQCRTIFMMSRYDGLKYPEIASKLNISVNTIQNQVCKALKILREELRDITV
ncbi:MAG: RNA polymerase sigma-70 factor [Chryseolinea sp.]